MSINCINLSNPEIKTLSDEFGELLTAKIVDSFEDSQIPTVEQTKEFLASEDTMTNDWVKSSNNTQLKRASKNLKSKLSSLYIKHDKFVGFYYIMNPKQSERYSKYSLKVGTKNNFTFHVTNNISFVRFQGKYSLIAKIGNTEYHVKGGIFDSMEELKGHSSHLYESQFSKKRAKLTNKKVTASQIANYRIQQIKNVFKRAISNVLAENPSKIISFNESLDLIKEAINNELLSPKVSEYQQHPVVIEMIDDAKRIFNNNTKEQLLNQIKESLDNGLKNLESTVNSDTEKILKILSLMPKEYLALISISVEEGSNFFSAPILWKNTNVFEQEIYNSLQVLDSSFIRSTLKYNLYQGANQTTTNAKLAYQLFTNDHPDFKMTDEAIKFYKSSKEPLIDIYKSYIKMVAEEMYEKNPKEFGYSLEEETDMWLDAFNRNLERAGTQLFMELESKMKKYEDLVNLYKYLMGWKNDYSDTIQNFYMINPVTGEKELIAKKGNPRSILTNITISSRDFNKRRDENEVNSNKKIGVSPVGVFTHELGHSLHFYTQATNKTLMSQLESLLQGFNQISSFQKYVENNVKSRRGYLKSNVIEMIPDVLGIIALKHSLSKDGYSKVISESDFLQDLDKIFSSNNSQYHKVFNKVFGIKSEDSKLTLWDKILQYFEKILNSVYIFFSGNSEIKGEEYVDLWSKLSDMYENQFLNPANFLIDTLALSKMEKVDALDDFEILKDESDKFEPTINYGGLINKMTSNEQLEDFNKEYPFEKTRYWNGIKEGVRIGDLGLKSKYPNLIFKALPYDEGTNVIRAFIGNQEQTTSMISTKEHLTTNHPEIPDELKQPDLRTTGKQLEINFPETTINEIRDDMEACNI